MTSQAENEPIKVNLTPEESPKVDRKELFARSSKIKGPTLSSLWENLREGRSITVGEFDPDKLLDQATISEAIRRDMTQGRGIPAEISLFISSPESRELSRRLGVEADFNNLGSEQSIKAVIKLASFLYYRQQIFNISNFPDFSSKVSIRGELSLNLPESVSDFKRRFNYCIKDSDIFNAEEKKSMTGFADAKIKLSAVLSYMVNQVDSPENAYSKTWVDFFGDENSTGMPYYNSLLKYSKDLHISLTNGLNDFFRNMGYERDAGGKLTRRKLVMETPDKKEYTREVDSNPDLLLNHVAVLPEKESLLPLIDKYLPGLKDTKIPEGKNGTRNITPEEMIKYAYSVISSRNWKNSQCETLMFKLFSNNFDTGNLNALAERNIAGPAALVSRAAESLYREEGNDKLKCKSKIVVDAKTGERKVVLSAFWGETQHHKGSAANKFRIGSIWPAFALWYARVDIFTKYDLYAKFFGVKYISLRDETKRATQLKDQDLLPISEAPLYKESNGELCEVMVKPVIARAYNLLIRELDKLRITVIGKKISPDASDFITGKDPVTDELFTTRSLTAGKDKVGIFNSLYTKFSKIFESFDKLSSPGGEDLALLNPSKVFELMKKLLYGGEDTSSQDVWDKYVVKKYKIPLITSALLTLSYAVWQKAVDYQYTMLSGTAEVHLLSKITQIKNFIGNRFFSINKPDRSLVALASYPYLRFLEGVYESLSDKEKRVMEAKAIPQTSNPAVAIYDNALLADYFSYPNQILAAENDVQTLDMIKLKSDLTAISSWLALDRIDSKEPMDYLPILGAYWGDILQDQVFLASHTPGKNFTNKPYVRSKQVEMISAYLSLRQNLGNSLSYPDQSGSRVNLGTADTLMYFEKNGFINEKGGQLAKMMAEDYRKILKEVSDIKVVQGNEVLEYMTDPRNASKVGFLRLFHKNFVMVNAEVNGITKLDRKLVEKNPDGYSGVAGAALAYKDYCATLVGLMNEVDTKMETSYEGEVAGKVARNIHELRARMNKYWENGEYEDLSISHFSQHLNPTGAYKDGKPSHGQDRILYYGDGYPMFISKLPGTMSGVLGSYILAGAPYSLGAEKSFIEGTNDALDKRTLQELPFDENELSLEKLFRHSVEQHGKVSFDHAEPLIRDIYTNVFVGCSRDSGRSEANTFGSSALLDKVVGWKTKGRRDEENRMKQEKERGGRLEEGIQAAGVREPLRAAGKQLGKRIWLIGSLLNKVGDGVEGIKNLPYIGMGLLGAAAGVAQLGLLGVVGVPLLFTFPLRWLDSVIVNFDFRSMQTKNPNFQYYSFATQKVFTELARRVYRDSKSPLFRGWAQSFLGNFPVNTSLEMKDIAPTIAIHVDYTLPKEPPKKS